MVRNLFGESDENDKMYLHEGSFVYTSINNAATIPNCSDWSYPDGKSTCAGGPESDLQHESGM